jgi:hypothetical protein
MPEIWLRYGSTDVVLDIRYENLLDHVSSNMQPLQEDQVTRSLDSVSLGDNTLVVALSSTKQVCRVIGMLAERARNKSPGSSPSPSTGTGTAHLTIDAPPAMASDIRSALTAYPELVVNRADYKSLAERIGKFQNTIFVSHVALHPMFGFSGVPTMLLRQFFHDKMPEAFLARSGDVPSPGAKTGSLNVALSCTDSLQATSIEIVANSSAIAGIHCGSIGEAFANASAHLASISSAESELAKSAIISASSEAGTHSTLASSLDSLWNSLHIVKEGGSAVLLAENKNGAGAAAIQMWIDGRIKPENIKQQVYLDGLEHLVYLEGLKQRYRLGIVSTVPQYYLRSRLGFHTYSGVKEALQDILSEHGKNHKVLVVSDADIVLLKQKTVQPPA